MVFTIHNLNYGQRKISQAAYYCQKFTTVSPTYAYETGEAEEGSSGEGRGGQVSTKLLPSYADMRRVRQLALNHAGGG